VYPYVAGIWVRAWVRVGVEVRTNVRDSKDRKRTLGQGRVLAGRRFARATGRWWRPCQSPSPGSRRRRGWTSSTSLRLSEQRHAAVRACPGSADWEVQYRTHSAFGDLSEADAMIDPLCVEAWHRQRATSLSVQVFCTIFRQQMDLVCSQKSQSSAMHLKRCGAAPRAPALRDSRVRVKGRG
jgi:hypothetical protein